MGEFSDDGCSWNEADSLDAVGLTESKFSDGGWSWNEANSLDALGLIGSKSSDGGCSWNETDSLDALGSPGSKFSDGGCSWNSVAATRLTASRLWQPRLFPFSAGPVQSRPQTNRGLG